MPDITPTNTINIATELAKLDLYKYHPNGILNVSLNRLSDMLDGKVEITDPANPFTYLLETSALNTAFAVQEYTTLTRKLYPRLANSEDDLFLHMSDYDYLGIFSEPSYGHVIFNILFNDFKTKATYDSNTKDYVLKLPRHLKITVDKYIFTLTSAIIIRLTESGIVDVKFENQTFNNIFPVETNYINFNMYKVNQEETYINFTLKLPEVDIEPIEIPIEKSKLFKNTLTFNPKRKFYFFRAFYMKDSVWKEMLVTHTDEIYDIYTPTCVVKVYQDQNSLEYYIPPVYINSDLIESKVKFLIYTTNGYINVNFSDFIVGNFASEYNPVFPDEELDVNTEPLQLISKVIYIQDKIVGGKDNISFSDLKTAVIENSIGDRKLPITNKQNEFSILQNNFRLIKDIDVVTNRIFLLETDIPKATTRYPITKINLDIIEYKTTVEDLKIHGNNIVDVNQYTTIIPENTVFKLTTDGLKLLTQQEFTVLSSMSGINLTTEVNNNIYLSTMYHYILDTSANETELRPYDISSPLVNRINFKEFNPTARVGINTTNASMTKSTNGYTLNILSNLKKYVNTISETNVTPYLVYIDNNGSKFYLQASLYTSINNNPVYKFQLETNYYINRDNRLNITNFKDLNNNQANIFIDLNSNIELIYVSNIIPQNYVSSELDNYIFNSFLAVNKCVVTLEELNIKFCDYLEYLYAQVHTSTGTQEYEVHDEDEPLRHGATVYNYANEIVHHKNDPVLDNNGATVIKNHKGDVKQDSNGKPIPIGSPKLNRYLNLLFMDYRAYVASKKNIVDYKKYIKDYLTEKVVEDAVKIQDQLLENTVAYVVVPKNINITTIKTPYRTVNISCLQSFDIDVHVSENVYNDVNIRDNIEYTIINEIDNYLSNNSVLNKTGLLDILYSKLKEYVKSISVTKFTELNDEYIEVLNTNYRIGLNKLLTVDADGYNLAEDINISFVLV
jgi:hypothetical protein